MLFVTVPPVVSATVNMGDIEGGKNISVDEISVFEQIFQQELGDVPVVLPAITENTVSVQGREDGPQEDVQDDGAECDSFCHDDDPLQILDLDGMVLVMDDQVEPMPALPVPAEYGRGMFVMRAQPDEADMAVMPVFTEDDLHDKTPMMPAALDKVQDAVVHVVSDRVKDTGQPVAQMVYEPVRATMLRDDVFSTGRDSLLAIKAAAVQGVDDGKMVFLAFDGKALSEGAVFDIMPDMLALHDEKAMDFAMGLAREHVISAAHSPLMPQLRHALGQVFPAYHAQNAPYEEMILHQTQSDHEQRKMIELEFFPKELGRLRVFMAFEGDVMRVHLSAERPETLDLMRRHAGQLEQELHSAGYSGFEMDFGSWQQEPDSKDNQPEQQEGTLPKMTSESRADFVRERYMLASKAGLNLWL